MAYPIPKQIARMWHVWRETASVRFQFRQSFVDFVFRQLAGIVWGLILMDAITNCDEFDNHNHLAY